MTTYDIFSVVTTILNKNTVDDVNGLYNLSQTCNEMNTIVKLNTDYNVLKKIARYPNLCKAVCDNVNNAINDCTNDLSVIDIDKASKIAFENNNYIVDYLTKIDIIDINAKICVLFLDWDNTCIPRTYRDRCIIEGKILCDFIKKIDKNYNISLILPLSYYINNEDFDIIEEVFNNWLYYML